ncbi:MAG: CPXCG motif-containing cysteine-rich protein [Flavobacteriaceae bacterium]|jgi:predicted DsbA family dithiol-disulfide isomerase|nr:CPXCG motif-containing cysteine-rich protein [Flavobacteriaceae bacterium]
MLEHFFQCPYCWQTISMLLDQVEEEQQYIEDCEVCCRPIQLNYHYSEELVHFSAHALDE